ncbi:hypothetical protein FOA52_013368 [Chlamydomonas sp. UWO 241]|nr:hypothetical protein FOA52_013368 [Chlamydomonas sp. UWO 241]
MMQGLPCIATLLELQPSDSFASPNSGGQDSTLLGAVLTQNDASDTEEGDVDVLDEDVDAETDGDDSDSVEMEEEEHEVTALLVTDPVTGRPACLITQVDISARAHVERQMAALTGAQLAMLESVFPRHVLENVVAGNTHTNNCNRNSSKTAMSTLATQHSKVSILFMDIVGFTSMAKEVPAHQVMEFLRDLFSVFDTLCDHYGVYKVKTAGDCYIVTGALMCRGESGFLVIDPCPNARAGAGAVLAFAKAMLAHARRVVMPHNRQPTTVRIDIHTSACVSGLIGTRQPKFALFGDTMNTSSRMESTATPGCIQVSEATYVLLFAPDMHHFQPTHGIEVKGKGLMDTDLYEPSDADMGGMERELVAAEEAKMEVQQVAVPARHAASRPGAVPGRQAGTLTADISVVFDRVIQLLSATQNTVSSGNATSRGNAAAAVVAAAQGSKVCGVASL